MGLLSKLFGNKEGEKEGLEEKYRKKIAKFNKIVSKGSPKCEVCKKTNQQILDEYRSKGTRVYGNAVGICVKCTSIFCSEHSVKSSDGWGDNYCPHCKLELNWHWDNKDDEYTEMLLRRAYEKD